MAYNERVKNFNRIRDYMREFYVYGFKSRDEFTKKSARSYDDEKRRLESWLGDYMQFRQTADGKNVFLSIDSRLSRHNPLYKAWKTKSFTDGDITLHFIIFDILYDPEKKFSIAEIMKAIDTYLSEFQVPRMFDESTVRKKLKEYVNEGLIVSEKTGRTVYYRKSKMEKNPEACMLDFYSEVAPCGVIGSFLLDKLTNDPKCFAFKHHYITSAKEMSNWANYEFLDIHDDERRAQVCGVPEESIRKNVKAIMLSEPLESAKKKALAIIERGQWPKFFFTKNGYGGIARKTYLDDSKGKVVTNFWSFEDAGHTDEAKKEIVSIFDDKAFSTPKPERLIMQIIYVATQEGDLVLDYHLGSGTTCAVAHQMRRKYIGIEQMDYIQSLCVERLRYNISGGETNISADAHWQGGGSFVYCELAKLNQAVIEDIEAAADDEALADIYERMMKSGFISYKVNPADIEAAADDYAALSLDDKKRFLMEILDKNLLYVNYCDIDDEEFGISDEDKAFTRSFYREG